MDVDSVFGLLHHVVMGDTADILEVLPSPSSRLKNVCLYFPLPWTQVTFL
jgi:hypothetical protein